MPPILSQTRASHRTPLAGTRAALVVASLASLFLASACSYLRFYDPDYPLTYRIDIQQGVVVTQEMVAQLHPGMTRDQVKFVMGTPPLIDPFHADRWDYPFRFQPGRGRIEERHFTVYFENDKMVKAEGDAMPTEKEFVAQRLRINATQPKPFSAKPDTVPQTIAPPVPNGPDNSTAPKPATPASQNEPTASSASDSGPSLWERLSSWVTNTATGAAPSSPSPAPPEAPAGPGGRPSP